MIYLERQGFGQRYNLDPNKDRFLIGRSTTSDIIFTSVYVSRRHCEIQRIPPFGTLIITNCTPTNSTHVDNTELNRDNQMAELPVGAVIGLGVPPQLSQERLNDERFVYLKVCIEYDNNVSREVNEISSSTLFNESKASTITPNISQEEIDISSNISHDNDIDIVYSASTAGTSRSENSIKKGTVPLHDSTSVENLSGSLDEPSNKQSNEKVPANYDLVHFSENQRIQDDFVIPSIPERWLNTKQFAKNLKEENSSLKFKKHHDDFLPDRANILKINSINEIFPNSRYVAKENASIRECKLEISSHVEDELAKSIKYEYINGVMLQNIMKPIKTESISSIDDEGQYIKEEKDRVGSPNFVIPFDANSNSSADEEIITISDDEQDEMPSSLVLQKNKDNIEDTLHCHDYNNSKKRRSNVDASPPPKRLKTDCEDTSIQKVQGNSISNSSEKLGSSEFMQLSHLKKGPTTSVDLATHSINLTSNTDSNDQLFIENKVLERTDSSSKLVHTKNVQGIIKEVVSQISLENKQEPVKDYNIPVLSMNHKQHSSECMIKPTSVLNSKEEKMEKCSDHLILKNREEETKKHDCQPFMPDYNNLVKVKPCRIQLHKVPEDRIRSLIEMPCKSRDFRLEDKTFPKNNIISDSESENNSESEMSVDDPIENTEGKADNLDVSLKNLSLEDEEKEVKNVDVAKIDIDITKVKREPSENTNFQPFLEMDSSDDDEDHDIQISYSQVDEVIMLSSDDDADESNLSLENVSFGPIAPLEIECEIKYPSVAKYEEAENELPDLTSSTFQQEENISTEGSEENSNRHVSDDDELEREEWWPILSQNFYVGDELDGQKKIEAEIEKQRRGESSKLKNVIEKLSNKHISKSKLTEPKLPPKRTKADTIPQKRGRARRTEQNEIAPTKTSKVASKASDKDDSNVRLKHLNESLVKCPADTSKVKSRSHSSSPSTSKLRNRSKKSPDIRKTLQKTHNFEIYKEKSEKKHYHLIDKSSINLEKNVRVDTAIHQENISILPKQKESPNTVKKGIAKISSKSRSEKLTEVNLFSSSTEKLTEVNLFSGSTDSKPKTRSSKTFRIPKVQKSEAKIDLAAAKSSHHSILDVEKHRIINSVNVPIIAEEHRAHSSSTDPSMLLVSTEPESSGSRDAYNALDEPKKLTPHSKSILKDVLKQNSRIKRVHFPPRDEDLVAIRPISPRQAKNCSGPDVVQVREKYFGQMNVNVIADPLENVIIDSLEYILEICQWNYDWLQTYHEMKKSVKNPPPPSLVKNQVLPILTKYKSLNDYQQAFSTMLYYEAWENIYKDWVQHRENIVFLPCEIDVKEIKYIGEKNRKIYLKVKAYSLITADMSNKGHHPTYGSLIAVKNRVENKVAYSFGYVEKITKRYGICGSETLKRYSPQGANTIICFEIIFSKKRHIESEDFRPGMIVSLCNVCYFRPTYRAFECLFNLRNSPLLHSILDPGDLSVYDSTGSNKSYLVSQIKMNTVQMESIIEVSRKCVSERDNPNLSLIHGPPGTGKTRVITALLAQIIQLFKNSVHRSNRRILLCAPSNAAIDELVLRIGKLKDVGILLNIVRVGVKQSMHADVAREFSYDAKVNQEFDQRQFPNDEKVRAELKKKKMLCDQAYADLQKVTTVKDADNKEVEQKRRRLTELMRSRKAFEDSCKFRLNKRESAKLLEDCKKKVLMTAEIIAVTLTSCMSSCLQEVFGREKSPFSCCIIDEAGQCKESEIWFPLQFGIKKLVLVGDHMQLPATALSQLNQGKNLHQSLFERVYHHVGIEKCRMDVIHTLKVQYRMHHDILAWPSLRFYNNDLVTATNISEERKHALCPYLIFDAKNGGEEENNNGEISNKREAFLIRALIECHEKYLHRLSIGVLTPYAKQKLLLIEKLSHLTSKLKLTISTVDNFQGQERDIIYCSFVRSNSTGKIGFVSNRNRLNVALTRARRSCFVVGDLSSLQSNTDWRSLIKDATDRHLVRYIPPNMNFVAEKNKLLEMTLTEE